MINQLGFLLEDQEKFLDTLHRIKIFLDKLVRCWKKAAV